MTPKNLKAEGRFTGLLEKLGAFSLVIWAPLGFILLATATLFRQGISPPSRSWVLLWAGLLLPLPFQLWAGHSFGWLLGQSALGLAATLFLKAGRRALLWGLTLGLLCTAAFGLFERRSFQTLWYDDTASQTVWSLLRGISVLDGDSPGWRRNGLRRVVKTWSLPPGVERLELTFQAKRVSGVVNWDWYTNDPQTQVELHAGEGEPFTRITHPDRRYIVRRITTQSPVADRTFRVSAELRASESVVAAGCALQLRTFQETYSTCESVELDTSWRRYTLATTFPPDAELPAFELVVRKLEAAYLDIRNVAVQERRSGRWVTLAPPEPAGVLVRLDIPEHHIFAHPSLQFIPRDTWQSFSLVVEPPFLKGLERANFVLQPEGGLAVAVRNLELTSLTPDLPNPRPLALTRFSYWFSHANLASHTVVTVGIVLLLFAQRWWLGLSVFLVTFVSAYLTGSRAALLALALGGLFVLWLNLNRKGRLLFLGLLVGGFVATVYTGSVAALWTWRDFSVNPVERLAVWQLGYETARQHPLFGIGEHTFARVWEVQQTTPISHAHNLWLEFAASYGLPGLLSSLWLTGGLLTLAWRWGRWRGLALVVPVLTMNLFDYTLFYSGVLFPLVLGLNTLRQGKPGALADSGTSYTEPS